MSTENGALARGAI